MTDNYKGAYSINTLVKEEKKLNIPIYQRLFVWEEEQINLLLNDLYNSFSSSNEDKAPYYIGIITVVKNKDKWDVVDGQQRLTFLSLFGAFSCSQSENEQWKEFLFTEDGKNELRIHYTGRPEDCEDLKKIAEKKNSEIQNNNFRTFLECIQKFKKEKDSAEKTANNWNEFADYVYKKASFLISELPENYAPEDLNLFFEKMNATGRQLTAVEQIKGKYFPAYAATFDTCLNFEKAFQAPSEANPSGEPPSLLKILCDDETKVTPEAPNEIFDEAGTRSILSPEVFLLHCLEIAKNSPSGEQQSSEIEIPHDERKILETFKAFVGNENGKLPPNTLLDTMKEYRKWLDANIIYLEASSDGSWEYRFRSEDAKQGNKQNEDPQDKDQKSLKQFQSMLYVSSSNYQQWVLEAYRKRNNEKEPPVQPQQLLKDLKEQDNARHSTKPEHMTYPNIDRYWFWKLDYLLWERIIDNNSIDEYDLKEDEKTAIRNYKFRRNRSIEHLHPQTDGGIKEWDDAKHHFGNLAMISSSFNSFQQNDSVGVKFARLQETQIPNKNLESIKLLLMFKLAKGKEEGWTIKNANEHGEAMCKLLEQSYKNSNQDNQVGQG